MRSQSLFLMALATLPAFVAASPTRPYRPTDSVTAAPDFYVQLGDMLTARYRYEAARMRYEMAADLDRIDGILPVEALRRIANTHYFEADYGMAREKLVELAGEAAEIGEWEVQLWALADAAWLADLAQDEVSFQRHLQQCDLLLDAHKIADARRKVRTLLLNDFTPFAPHLTYW